MIAPVLAFRAIVEEILEEWREPVPPTPYDMDVCFPYPKDEDPK